MLVRIVFRGLLVFHKMNDHVEIGVMDVPVHAGGPGHPHQVAHVPRIIKTKNGVISQIYDLRNRSELRPPAKPGHVRDWEIFVTHPLQETATTFQHGQNFDRLSHPNTKDYRWIADLEGNDLYNKDLTAELQTNKLLMVLKVQNGEFYTQQLSKPLIRKTMPNGDEVEFGMAAEVIGCDIPIDRGEVQLRVDENNAYTFDETTDDNVVYEFSNAPPDVPSDHPYPLDGPGHFHMYYKLFAEPGPPEWFDLIPQEEFDPAPDPALCGASGLGKRPGSL